MDVNIFNEWLDFKNEIIYKNRYISKHPMLDKLKAYLETTREVLTAKNCIYRARVVEGKTSYEQEDTIRRERKDYCHQLYGKDYFESLEINKKNELFKNVPALGYGPKNSGAPPIDKTRGGRSNHRFIPHFYAAGDKLTALIECKPVLTDYVSIATYQPKKNINISNINVNRFIGRAKDEINNFEYYMSLYLTMAFSEIVKNSDDEEEYIFPQYLSEFIKSNGFDGVCYKSSLKKEGLNYAFYDIDSCSFVRSDVYTVDEIVLVTSPQFGTQKEIDEI